MPLKAKYTGELSIPVPSGTATSRYKRALRFNYTYLPYLHSMYFVNATTKNPVNTDSILFDKLKSKLIEKYGQ